MPSAWQLPEHLGAEAEEGHARPPPRLSGEARLQADLLEEPFRVPAPFRSDLGQEETAPAPLLDIEAVRSDLDLRGVRDLLARQEHRDLDVEQREIAHGSGREPRIVEE